MNTLAITGTNTDIGKTYVACGIVRELKNRGIDVGVFKPFCSGSRDDAEKLILASGVKDTIEEVNPFYFEQPLAPYHALKLEGKNIDIKKCFDAFDILRHRHDLMIVEVGVFKTPAIEKRYQADIEAMGEYLKSDEPPEKEKEISFDEVAGRFYLNWKITYSPYLKL